MSKTPERGGFLLATGATAAALLVGCGGTGNETVTHAVPPSPAPKVGRIICEALKPGKWKPTGGQLQADRAASALGVTDQQIEDGKIGEADCDPAVPADPVGAGQAVVVTIKGIKGIEDKACLVIGLNSGGHAPEPHHSYHGVIAACAAPPSLPGEIA